MRSRFDVDDEGDNLVNIHQRSSFIGSVIDTDDEDEGESFNCPSCLDVHIASRLTPKIIYVTEKQETPFGLRSRIIRNKNKALDELGLDNTKGKEGANEKQYLQCRRCGDIYLVADLKREKRYQDRLADAIEYQDKYWNPNPPRVRKSNVLGRGHSEEIKSSPRRTSEDITSRPVKGKVKQITRPKIIRRERD